MSDYIENLLQEVQKSDLAENFSKNPGDFSRSNGTLLQIFVALLQKIRFSVTALGCSSAGFPSAGCSYRTTQAQDGPLGRTRGRSQIQSQQ